MLDTFDFTASDGSVNAAQIAELARGEWIGRAENIIFAGPIWTGKTHLAIALGVEAHDNVAECCLLVPQMSCDNSSKHETHES